MSEGDRELPLQTDLSTAPGTQPLNKKQKFNYTAYLKEEFGKLIDLVDLPPIQKEFLRSRWLDQILWMEGRAANARNWHRRLRLTTIVGGVILPALVTLNLNKDSQEGKIVYWGTFVVSQVVAISAASEQFFNNGDRWRHYRRSVESLKTHGWQFFQLTGPYAIYSKAASQDAHKNAFTLFAGQVEEILQRDVEVYSTQVVQEKKDEERKKPNGEE